MRLAEKVLETRNLQAIYSSLPGSTSGPAESFATAFFDRLGALGAFSLAC